MINQLFQIFSTREVSTIIWGILFLTSMMFIKGMPKILGDFLKVMDSKIVIIFTLISAIYTTLIVILLWKLSLWDITF
jgi:succinate dehydrogenase hydrophobic anchor subunit